MTTTLALMHLLAASSTKKTSSSSFIPLLVLAVIAIFGYFFFLKPQQRKAAAARAGAGTGYEVGDEVQTIGGVIGTILEINGDRYTLLTGATDHSGNIDGLQPTRIVFVRQAIARKVDRIVEADDLEDSDHSDHSDHDHGSDAHDHSHIDDDTDSGADEETEEA